MKKFSLLLIALLSGSLFGADLVTPQSFVANYKKIYKTGGFSLQDNVLKITALPQGNLTPDVYKKRNGGQKLIMLLKNVPPADLPGAVLKLDFEAKITKISGKVEVCVRMVNAKGKSLGYPNVNFSKWSKVPEWKKFSKTIKISKDTHQIYIFIWARYLGADDDVQIRNVKLTRLK